MVENADMIDDKAANRDEGDAEEIVQKPVIWEMPHPRFNAQLTVQDDTLYIYSGTFEKGDREFTFDEMWSIDLGKLDGVKEVFRRELEDWQGSEDEESDEEDDDDAMDEEEDEDATEPSASIASVAIDDLLAPSQLSEEPDTGDGTEPQTIADGLPHPRPFESLREFFARTSNEWQDVVLEAMKYERDTADRSVKEIRKKAFERADIQWWQFREEIQALEDEQEAAGIGEVVNLEEKASGQGVGRRR